MFKSNLAKRRLKRQFHEIMGLDQGSACFIEWTLNGQFHEFFLGKSRYYDDKKSSIVKLMENKWIRAHLL